MDKNNARELSFALRAAKRNKERAYLQASNAYEEYQRLANRHLEVDFSFPNMEEGLHQLQSCIDEVFLHQEDLHRIAHQVERAKESASEISRLGKTYAGVIQEVCALREQKHFESAIALLKQHEVLDAYKGYKFAKTYAEVASYLLVSSYHDLAEARIQKGESPLSEAEYADYESSIDKMILGMHTKQDKAQFKDHLHGIYYYLQAEKLSQTNLTVDNLDHYHEILDSYRYKGFGCSRLTLWRFDLYRSGFYQQFNKACSYYFDERPEYKDALVFFAHRDYLPYSYLEHPCYREANDEESFRACFLTQDMLRKEDVDFKLEVRSILQTVKEAKDIPSVSVARLYCHPNIGEAKRKMILEILKLVAFSQRIFVIEACFDFGINDDTKHLLLPLLLVPMKQRKCNLEAVAPSLSKISNQIQGSDKEAFDELVASLYRSGKAHRICIKSEEESVRLLSKKKFGLSLGKKISNSTVKARSRGAYACLKVLSILLPILLMGASVFAIYSWCPEDAIGYALLAPILFAYLYILMMVLLHYGRDERGSIVAKRIIAFVSLALAIWAMLYFIMPEPLSFYRLYGYMTLILALLIAVPTQIILKEHKVKLGFIILWLALIVSIAASIFLILDTINGLI